MNQQLILTPNRRLAAFLLQAHNKQQAAANKRSWQTPAIYPIEAWFSQLWQLVLEHSPQDFKPTLNKIQQQVLWEQIIQNSVVGAELLRVAPTAKNALQAWQFLCQWQISITKLAAYAEFSADTAAFYAWLQAYLQWLEANDFTDFSLMVNQLMISIPQIIKQLPRTICLMGVDDMPPQYQSFFNVLREHGIQIEQQQIVQSGANVSRTAFANDDQELQAAANWALEQMRAQPEQIIGVVVPQLEMQRQKVVRIFSTTLAPETMNISAPLALGTYPLIDTALLILQVAKHLFNYADFSVLLRSPFIKNAELEINLRALLDRVLREDVEAKVTWDNINTKIAGKDTTVQNLISEFMVNFAKLQGRHAPDYWLKIFHDLLSSWGWPGDRALTIEEAHLLSCWQDLLHNYAQLAQVIEEHSYHQALQYIQRLASETPFLPAETGLTKVHVLGVLEAAGLAFDQLWVTGMDRNSWPPDAAPNPFIPLELQRQVDMPRSSPQRELKVARRLTATLMQGATNTVIFSYPQCIDDHHTQPSNLIADLPVKILPHLSRTLLPESLPELETIADHNGAPLINYEIKGGTAVLKAQAQCPFKAYAEYRLRADVLVEPQLILSSADRGKIVHAVMEDFWQQCKCQAELSKTSPAALLAILSNIIERVLTQQQRKLPQTLTTNYMLLERNRLLVLLQRWLAYEKTRAPFTVTQIEQKLLLVVGPLSINLRIDRIDTLEDNTQIVIDYKTGISRISSWSAERIVEPQLPLYTLQLDDSLVAIAVANMRPDDISFRGMAADDDLLPNVKPNVAWAQQLANWREVLTRTATDFASGLATLDPYAPHVCTNCSLQALCRIYDC